LTAHRIITAAETDGRPDYPVIRSDDASVADSVAAAAVSLAARVTARAIVAYTTSGRSAQRLAARRADIAIVAVTPDEGVCRQLALTWGVESIVVDRVTSTDEMVVAIDTAIRTHRIARPGEQVVVVAGTPVDVDQAINTVRVHTVS
jgi:pyruvate kinase